ncbi:hypothetical protein LSH36_1204g00018 [Paralvinella palmiformis]|uniref:Uncharacterized protein n=1 Tax=Paralvinella palmiformis TaxID=53620 RepID=A0AAD9IVB0_9ANNE|nr:hypothetical protein LSH36_1204g00018 [Paralvinella palmiformis]
MPDNTTQIGRNYSCPDACVVNTHSIELSSSLISGLSAESLLSIHREEIERRYFEATEYRLRVTPSQMVGILERLRETSVKVEHFQAYLKTNIFGSRTSIVNRVKDAIVMMERVINSSIYEQMFKDRERFLKFYDAYMEPSVVTAKSLLGEVSRAATTFGDKLFTYNYENINYMSKTEQYYSLLEAGQRFISTLDRLLDTLKYYEERNLIAGKYLPNFKTNDAAKRKLCEQANNFKFGELRQSVADIFESINATFSTLVDHFKTKKPLSDDCYRDLGLPIPEYVRSGSGTRDGEPTQSVTGSPDSADSSRIERYCNSFWTNHSEVVDVYSRIKKLEEANRHLQSCYSEYGDFLLELNEWLRITAVAKKKEWDGRFDFVEMMQSVKSAASWLQNLTDYFMSNKMSLFDVARELRQYEKEKFIQNVEQVYEGILEKVITPIYDLLKERENGINEIFLEAIRYHERFTNYFSNVVNKKLVETARKLPIWRRPVPNLDSPTVIILFSHCF